ncbi:MAG: hypothetical protein KGH49_02355 [Candidatus Micrarchaeota archaeon]|nr:hypothetical protein [Candidatus Micrarchaeota archaeon]
MQKTSEEGNEQSRLKFYAIIVLIIAALAVAVSVFPKGTALQQCTSIIITQNRDSCLYTLAVSTGNNTACSQIQGQSQGSCYSAVAVATRNASMCSNSGSNQSVSGCIIAVANYTSNPNLCASVPKGYADGCYSELAVKMGSFGTCAMIANGTIRAACSSALDINTAFSSINASICKNASASADRTFLSYVFNMTRKVFDSPNQTVLTELSSIAFLPGQNYSAHDLCYAAVAYRAGTTSPCIGAGQSAQALCTYAAQNYTSQSLNYTQLLSSCKALQKYSTQCTQYVLLSEAINTKNTTICASLPQQMSWSCYDSLASTYKNATYCGYITNSSANSDCLLQEGQ